MDFDKLDKLLSLSERLNGHPKLSGMKTLVDEEVDKMRIDSDKEVAKLAADKKAAQVKIDAEKARVAAIHDKATAARARIAEGRGSKEQIAEDEKLIAESDKVHAEEAKARGEVVAIPAHEIGPSGTPAPPHHPGFFERTKDRLEGHPDQPDERKP
jgi:hypothetical protein